ncbi:MAG TPA: multicopper oxidase domain-containing protein, partial [Terriglobales bacterium]|nr:multicopper oxidase domain-containing protein [Terriglobales bacterium]
ELPKMKMSGMDTVAAPIQYDIHVPSDHPSGLYWFHPHAHGLSLNQVAHGLGGIITVGAVSDYVQLYGQHVRHLILKDMQIRKDGSVLSQEDARFCTTFPFPSEPVRNGFCPGTLQPTGADYRGGNWFFSVNGQIFPTITVGDHGDIWRITNASGSATYLLKLIDDATRKPIPFRVVATDGVSTAIPMGMPIPGAPAASTPKACEDQETSGRDSICTTQLLVMPSSRVEVFVPSHFGSAKTATLIQASYGTGPGGDSWPTVKLAKVVFSSTPVTQASEQSVVPKVTSWKAPIDEPHQAVVKTASATPGTGDASCSALAPGHRRRIFFGIPKNSLHGLGYEEVDEKGNPVPGTFRDIVPFEHGSTTVCLPLGPGGTPVTETWELINVSSEDHNFHMHQSRFRVISDAGGGDSNLYMDSIPLPHGSWGCTGTVQRWRSGACTVKPVVVAIRFTEAGDFAYHCHILSHGDAGMMAHIRVVTAEGKTASSDSQHSGK